MRACQKATILLWLILIPTTSIFSAIEDNSNNEKFEFDKQLDNSNEVEIVDEYLNKNYLGEEIARKYYVLQELYTYEVEGTATSPTTKTIVEKPSIYYALKKLNKHYKKQVKKDNLEMGEAIEQLSHFLDIGISIRYQTTAEFEKYLSDKRKREEIAKAFSNVVLE